MHVFISFRLHPHLSCQRNQQHSCPQQNPQSSNRHATQRTLNGQVRLSVHLNSFFNKLLFEVISYFPFSEM